MIINCVHGGWHKVKDLLSEIESYWTTRAEGYSEVNHKELNGMQKGAWLEVLKGQFPEKAKDEIKILDIGTGPGFFPVILAEAGYKVTAVDYTQEMLDTAKRNAGNLCERISFYKMDAQNLEFEDDVFDVVISRNLTWNLKDPKRAYEEWCRVLKPGGHLVILELTTPDRFPMKQLFAIYSKVVIPLLGKLLSKDNSAYHYLPDTIKVFPQGEVMKGVISKTGFGEVHFRRLTFGICTLYTATK